MELREVSDIPMTEEFDVHGLASYTRPERREILWSS